MPGEMTLQDYRDELETASQRSGFDVTYKLHDRWINQALREFAYRFKFHEMEGRQNFPLVDGAYSYVIDSGISDFRALSEEGVWVISPEDRVRKLIPESRVVWLRSIDLFETTARECPRWYHKYGSCMFFRPVPDSTDTTVQLHYWKTIKLTGAGDVQPLAADWDDIVLVGALARCMRHFGELERAFNLRADFLGMLRSRVDQYDLEEFPEGGISVATEQNDLTGEERSNLGDLFS